MRRAAACNLAGVVGVAAAIGVACSGTPTSPLGSGPVPGVPFDGGASDDASGDALSETGGPDTTPPARITDLRATATGIDSVRLEWTAPGDDGAVGTARSYEVRRAGAPILSEADFAAATAISPAPTPLAAGGAQTMAVTGLAPGRAYHFAVRAFDEVPNAGPLSNSATATTQPRAQLLVSEVAVANTATEGYDFVELVAVTGGRIDGLAVRQGSTTLHAFASLTVAAGDRVVVHTTGLPGPTGFAQEDATGTKGGSTAPFASANAYDVYSATTGLVGTDTAILVVEGTTIVDAVAISARDGDAATATMGVFAGLATQSQWVFGATPVDGSNDCATQRDAVSVAQADTACGGFDVGAGPGRSVNRFGTADTNSKRDFYVAAQTPGEPNTPPAAPTVVSVVATSATQAQVRFSQEIAPATVTAGAFTIAGLAVSAASLADVHVVTLTTATQTEGMSYATTVASAVQNYQAIGVGAPAGGALCGYSPGATMIVNEVAPSLSADLVELRVTRGGTLQGLALRVNPDAGGSATLLANMPAICALQGDLVVVHLDPASAGAGAIPMQGMSYLSETTAKNQHASATYSAFYDGAWDVASSNSTPLASTDTVLVVVRGATILDAVAFSNRDGASSATFQTALAYIQAQGHWLPANCGGVACTDATTPSAQSIAASYAGVGTTTTGNTVRRDATGTDTHGEADWSVGAQSLGGANP